MKLINVRKGQFVYYNDRLHKVYAVKPFFKQSVHLIQLEKMEQQLTTAKDIDYYKPKHMDSFIYNHVRYTLHKEVKAEVGDYILVVKPRPDSLDHHYLHAIEMVSSVETNGIISNKSNGIKHNEYWVMVPELLEGANIIDWQHPRSATDEDQPDESQTTLQEEIHIKIGDVFQKVNSNHSPAQTMVIAIKGDIIFLGAGLEVTKAELADLEKWVLVHSIYRTIEED